MLIDSCIRELSVCIFECNTDTDRWDFGGLCRVLRMNARRIQLERLHLQHPVADDGDKESFLMCLPQLVTLNNVQIKVRVEGQELLDAVRQNGSLQSIETNCSLDDVEQIRLDTYLERNKQLTKMIAAAAAAVKATSRCSKGNAPATVARPDEVPALGTTPPTGIEEHTCAEEASEDSLDLNEDTTTTTVGSSAGMASAKVSFLPALFAVSMPVHQMSPNNVLLGISSIQDNIKHVSGSKRAVASDVLYNDNVE